MKLSTRKFSWILFLQLSFLCCDLVANCISLIPTRQQQSSIVLFIFQDSILVLSIAAMLMSFFSTYLFQAGLVQLLFDKFKPLIFVSLSYLVMNILTHSVWLVEKWEDDETPPTYPLLILFTIQRCISPWYYFFYKRAALRISDPRFYEDMDWINQQINRK